MEHYIINILETLLGILNEMSPYILLGFLCAGLLHAFVKQDFMAHHFSGNGFRQSFKAALLGVPLPLCSCGVLPTAISLRRNGASPAATTSFLIATPQTGVDSIAATYSLLGLGFAITRPVAAFISAVLGGTLMGRLTKETAAQPSSATTRTPEPDLSLRERIIRTFRYGFIDMVGSVGKWLIIGLIIAALITVLVPDDFFIRFADYPILAMLAVVVIAVPMYVCATGSIPIALSLMMKGLSPGTAFVFLMAGPAVNFASYALLSRTMGRRNTLIYIAIIASSAIITGCVIDYLLPSGWFLPRMTQGDCCAHHATSFSFSTICSIILILLMIYTHIIKPLTTKKEHITMAKEYRIDSMACVHCKNRVEKELATLPGVTSVTVDLDKKTATVEGDVAESTIRDTVNSLGYEYIEQIR